MAAYYLVPQKIPSLHYFERIGKVLHKVRAPIPNHLETREPSETTEKVHFFQNTNLVIKKRASRIASKAPFLLDDTLSTPKIFSFFVEDYFFSSLELSPCHSLVRRL